MTDKIMHSVEKVNKGKFFSLYHSLGTWDSQKDCGKRMLDKTGLGFTSAGLFWHYLTELAKCRKVPQRCSAAHLGRANTKRAC